MLRTIISALFALVLLIAFVLPSASRAESNQQPSLEGSPYDLINAVNALRASNGLPAYSISSILMYTAQSHAEFMAATGNVSHTGAGGSGVTDRLLSAGYPLAGDLSLGGFRSENIIGGSESMSAQSAVSSWTGDTPHLNTMLSPNLMEIGAGVAVANGRVYYVIDCARPTTSGAPQSSTQASGSGSTVPAGEAPIPVVIVSAANADGVIIHEVLAGQTLWQIAIAYNVKVDDIKALNNIVDNIIYPGDRLVIKKGQAAASVTLVETATREPTASPNSAFSDSTITPKATAPSSTPVVTPSASDSNSSIMAIVMRILALALLGGGIFSWVGSAKKE